MDHTHCENCVKIKICKSQQCPIKKCDLHCGQIYHQCKDDEHKLLCPFMRTSCINFGYGCRIKMLRHKLAIHLETCPASVIMCNSHWSRWKALTIINHSYKSLEQVTDKPFSNQLDVAFALADQFTLLKRSEFQLTSQTPSDTNQEAKCQTPGFFSYMGLDRPDLQVSNLDSLHTCINDSGDIQHTSLTSCSSAANEFDSSIILPASLNFEPAFETYICDDSLMPCYDGPKLHNQLTDLANGHDPSEYTISLQHERIVKFDPDRMVRCSCSQLYRRDEYLIHYKNIHNDIISGLNGWIEHRCPLFDLGCNFSQQRLYPDTENSKVVFSNPMRTFATTSTTDKVHLTNFFDNNLVNLPVEILYYLCGFLDSFSLLNLANVNTHMREVVYKGQLNTRGIVINGWIKNKHQNWCETKKYSLFTTGCTSIKKWGLSNQKHMANHLKVCPYFIRHERTAPYYMPGAGALPNPELLEKLQAGIDAILL